MDRWYPWQWFSIGKSFDRLTLSIIHYTTRPELQQSDIFDCSHSRAPPVAG